ncbi:uncharacterized protein LOC108681191 [Hyalella azteca]|uniref:Uncharacterized protein LOC108681191 n=1 Tax=Hyalella azteca TaxID=294128 RepID=A0A8B7PI63_HYAAZ|nr:uncharacterized protein LOC108681191 [Hyalella azteca]
MNHAGIYSTLTELRRQYFIPSVFSVAKKILRKCVTCRRSNERSIKLNQSSYRDFRVDPPAVPFRHCFIDHIGPFYVRSAGTKVKVWILCITCLWSRAINLKLSLDLSVKEFLRAFQKHVFEFGLPHLVLSDSGSQLIAGSKIISKVLQDPEVEAYCEASDIKITSFQQYPRGCSALGSLVESCVKLIKRLLFGSIGNNVLDLPDFDLAVAQITCLVNKRPVAFKETLRDSSISLPSPITPEALLRGYVLHSPLVLPHVSEAPDDPEWVPSMEAADLVRENFAKLNAVRRKLVDKYNSQFIPSLITQATSKKDGFRPVKHKVLGVNDLVLLKEPNQKRYNYAMGRVTEVTLNHLGEVTEVSVLKGNGGTVRRHVTSLIPLLTASPTTETRSPVPPNQPIVMETEANRPRRLAAQRGRGKIKDLIERNLI